MTQGDPGAKVSGAVEFTAYGEMEQRPHTLPGNRHDSEHMPEPLSVTEIQNRLVAEQWRVMGVEVEETDSPESVPENRDLVIECIPAKRGPHVLVNPATGRSGYCGGIGACRLCTVEASREELIAAGVIDGINRCDRCRKPMDTKRSGLCPICMVDLGETYPALKDLR